MGSDWTKKPVDVSGIQPFGQGKTVCFQTPKPAPVLSFQRHGHQKRAPEKPFDELGISSAIRRGLPFRYFFTNDVPDIKQLRCQFSVVVEEAA